MLMGETLTVTKSDIRDGQGVCVGDASTQSRSHRIIYQIHALWCTYLFEQLTDLALSLSPLNGCRVVSLETCELH